MTPHQLYVLVGVYPYTPADDGTYAATRSLMEDGLVRLNDDDTLVVTQKGQAHIHQMCLLTQPQEAWVDGNGNRIKL